MSKSNCIIISAAVVVVTLGLVSAIHLLRQRGEDDPPRANNLGQVELVESESKDFELGSDATCTLSGRHSPAGIEISVYIRSLNEYGVYQYDRSMITTSPGQQTSVVVGGKLVEFTPTLK
jgi:hypothetical protein